MGVDVVRGETGRGARAASTVGSPTVREVRTRADRRRFAALPHRLHGGDPAFVPPLRRAVLRATSPRHNPYLRTAEATHLLAIDATGAPVGRISASIDPAYVARVGPTGCFGWFDTVDDPQVVAALLGRAERWLAGRGMERMAGPYSYCSSQDFGLLVDGFEERPTLLQPYNPPSYERLLLEQGFAATFSTETFAWSRDRDEQRARAVLQRADRAAERFRLTTRPIDAADRDREIDRLYAAFVTSFADNHDLDLMDLETFRFQVAELGDLFDPRLVRFVERDGQVIGFTLLVADGNQVLAGTDGRMTPSFLLGYRRRRRAVHRAVVVIVGAMPDAVGVGVGRVLAGEVARVVLGEVPPYDEVHTTWIHEHNDGSRALLAGHLAEPTHRYRVYERRIVR